jgi:hypothetical protein
MRSLRKLRYRVFLLSLAVGSLSLGIWVFDYCVLFGPSWSASGVDRLFGFDAWYHYLSERGLLFIAASVLGLWLAALMWLLPGRLSDGRNVSYDI